MSAMSLSDDIHQIPRLFGDAIEQLGKLVQNEANIARAEMSQKVAQAAMGVAYLVGAAILAIPVLVLLLMALAIWLTQLGLSPITAHLVSAACETVGSAILVIVGMGYLKIENLKPKITLHEVKRNVTAAKEMAR
jgi:uncharacterized membrane protein YgcG